MKRILGIIVLVLIVPIFITIRADAATTPDKAVQKSDKKVVIYEASVEDASEVKDFIKTEGVNTQRVMLKLSGAPTSDLIEVDIKLPSYQLKRPLKRGDKVLVENVGDKINAANLSIISLSRQNNLLVWSFILLGLFIMVSGFKTNIKYLWIFIITMLSGFIVLLFYHWNTFVTFGVLFLWQILITSLFAYSLFKKRTPSIILSLSVIASQILAMGLVFIMNNIALFDTGYFEIFFPSFNEAREVMLYIFAVIVSYPLSVVFAEQIISASIKKKREDNGISKLNLIRHVSRSALKNLNIIFLTFFGFFFATFIGVVAIASKDAVISTAINAAPLSQVLSVGFLVLFNLLIFIPLVSFVSGMWLGKLESHELVTDQNLRQLEL